MKRKVLVITLSMVFIRHISKVDALDAATAAPLS